jgi:amino acid adenylation domain-containing protein
LTHECTINIFQANLWSLSAWIILFIFIDGLAFLCFSSAVLALTPHVKPGIYRRLDWKFVHIWFRLWLFNNWMSYPLATTLFANMMYRSAGARISLDCRKTKPGWWWGLPEMVTIEDECFSGDGACFGYPQIVRGFVIVERTTIKKRCLIGNGAVVEPGTTLPEKSTVGVNSIAPRNAPGGCAWLGSPPVGVPGMQSCAQGSWPWPSGAIHMQKWFFDVLMLVCLVLATIPVMLLCPVLVVRLGLTSHGTINIQSSASIFAPVLLFVSTTAFTTALTLLICVVMFPERLAMAWRRDETKVAPYWSSFCIRWDTSHLLLYGLQVIDHCFTGTEVQNVILRLMGARIGKNAIITQIPLVNDPEFVEIGDDCVVEDEAWLRSHTFEKFQLNLGRIKIEPRCSISSGSAVMALARIDKDSELMPGTVAVRGQELVGEGKVYVGMPARLASHKNFHKRFQSLPVSSAQKCGSHPDASVAVTNQNQQLPSAHLDCADGIDTINNTNHQETRGARAVHRILEFMAEKLPQRPAVEDAVGVITTYAELNGLANRLARYLINWRRKNNGKGLEGAVIALRFERGDVIPYASMAAVMKAGGAFCFIEPCWPADHAYFILQNSGAIACLVHQSPRSRSMYEPWPEQLTNQGIDAQQDFINLSDILGTLPQESSNLRLPVADGDLCYIMYTSGTTGRPKGVCVDHAPLWNLIMQERKLWHCCKPTDRVLQHGSFAFDMSLEEIWTLGFASGTCLVVATDPMVRAGPDFVEWLHKKRVSVAITVPTVLASILTASTDDSSSKVELDVHWLGVTGEACPKRLVDAFLTKTVQVGSGSRQMWNAYGPTEAVCSCTSGQLHVGETVTIGKAIPTYLCDITRHPETLDVPKEGSDGPGELLVGGPSLARGYLGLPKLTEEKFIMHDVLGRVYRTGDVVVRNAAGDLECLGRRDTQVKVRGQRIELEGLEACLGEAPFIDSCAFFVEGEIMQAVIVPTSSQDAEGLLGKVRDFLRDRVIPGALPQRVHMLDKMPFTSTGKLDRSKIQNWLHGKTAADQESSAQPSPPEDKFQNRPPENEESSAQSNTSYTDTWNIEPLDFEQQKKLEGVSMSDLIKSLNVLSAEIKGMHRMELCAPY